MLFLLNSGEIAFLFLCFLFSYGCFLMLTVCLAMAMNAFECLCVIIARNWWTKTFHCADPLLRCKASGETHNSLFLLDHFPLSCLRMFYDSWPVFFSNEKAQFLHCFAKSIIDGIRKE